jgi:peptidoglycan/LPS O-acetylase OafA/YrhL
LEATIVTTDLPGTNRGRSARVGAQGQRIYRPELDVLRFTAFLAVLLHHSLPHTATGVLKSHSLLGRLVPTIQQAMGFGLCLFFFLSSYLITSLLEVEKARTGSVHLKKFYVRRILRIWPLYLCFLGVNYLIGLRWKAFEIEPLRLLAMVLLAGNWFSLRFGMGSSDAIPHLWSISVEEQFYLIWPSLSRALGSRWILVICQAICFVSLATIWMLAAFGSSSLAIWLNSLPQTVFFSSGAFLALRIGMRQQRKSLIRGTLAVAGGLFLWIGTASFSPVTDRVSEVIPWRITLGYALVATGCACLLWGFLHLPDKLFPKPLLYLGRISYGLYVFHPFVGVALREINLPARNIPQLPGTHLLITVAPAALSYEFLERPFLKLKNRFELIHTRIA